MKAKDLAYVALTGTIITAIETAAISPIAGAIYSWAENVPYWDGVMKAAPLLAGAFGSTNFFLTYRQRKEERAGYESIEFLVNAVEKARVGSGE